MTCERSGDIADSERSGELAMSCERRGGIAGAAGPRVELMVKLMVNAVLRNRRGPRPRGLRLGTKNNITSLATNRVLLVIVLVSVKLLCGNCRC